MSEVQPQVPEQPEAQTQISEPSQVQPPAQPQHKSGFSGKQVVGIVFGVLAVLAIGLAVGGFIGYRVGAAVGANRTAAQSFFAPAPRALTPQTPAPGQPNINPRQFGLPFGQQLPITNPGGPYLGVQFEMITPQVAASEGITGTTGALLREVVADSPAAAAGLKQGDVITAINGKAVDEQNDLRARVQGFKAGDEITLTVVKGTANGPTGQHDVKVKLVERPADQSFGFQLPFGNNNNGIPALPFGNLLPFGNGNSQSAPAANGPYLGVEYEMITPDVAAREGITGTQGALIQSVVANSPAAKAGLKKGDVLTAVDGKTIDDTNNLRAIVGAHKAGDEITLTIVTGTANGPTGSHDVKVTLTTLPAQRQFQLPPGLQPGAPSLDSRSG